jgi:pimeloyl-ACP methyl ester carboxylesterase
MQGWALRVALLVGLGLLASVPSADAAGIAWRPCSTPEQKGFECARMQVPFDHDRPRGAQLELALIRHRATEPRRRVGTLFYEPGGPAVPGTEFLPALAYDGFPAEVRARFDIVSWDPRGVGESTAVRCFDTQADENAFFAGALTRNVDGFPVGSAQMTTWTDRYRAFGARCQQRVGRLLTHVSTVDTVRDLDLMRRRMGERRLTYVGTSYGTVVGAIYANLFPDRVRAMVLDGVVDSLAWTRPEIAENGGRFLSGGLRFRSDVESARTLEAFLDLCGRTDPAHCAFSAGTPEATRQKFTEMLARLPVEPTPGQTTYAQAVSGSVRALYVTANWPAQAEVLQQLWAQGPAAVPPPTARDEEQELAIACGEVPSPPPGDFPSIDAFAQQRSGMVGPFWAWDYEPCSTWPVRSAHRYAGPWNRRTASPVLVIGNTFDPATPLRGAVVMSQKLGRARLLTVEGYGHTALLNPSACASRHEARYLISGVLPPAGTRCAQDEPPFGA